MALFNLVNGLKPISIDNKSSVKIKATAVVTVAFLPLYFIEAYRFNAF